MINIDLCNIPYPRQKSCGQTLSDGTYRKHKQSNYRNPFQVNLVELFYIGKVTPLEKELRTTNTSTCLLASVT